MRLPKNTQKVEGVLIPCWLLKQSPTIICQGTKLCYGQLLRHGFSGQCFPRVKILAAELGVNRKQAQRYLANLIDLKLIDVEQNAGHSNNYYFLLHRWMLEEANKIKSTLSIPKGCPSLEKVFIKGILLELSSHPLVWHSWKNIPVWERRNHSFKELKERVKTNYENLVEKIKKGAKLKIP